MYEILFSTRFSTIFSTIFRIIFQNIKNQCIVPSLTTINHANIFTQDTYTLTSFQKKFALSIAQVFRKIHILPHVYQFSQWMRCAVFQINTDLLVKYQHVSIFTYEALHPSFTSKKIWYHPLRKFLEISTFIAHTYQFSLQMRCSIFQINTDHLVIYQNINISIFPSVIPKKIGALHRKPFSKHPLFNTLSLNQLRTCFYTRHLTPFLHFRKKIYALHHTNFQKLSLFTTCLLVFMVIYLLVIYQHINIFAYEVLLPSFIPEKNQHSPSQTFFKASTFYHVFTTFNSE